MLNNEQVQSVLNQQRDTVDSLEEALESSSAIRELTLALASVNPSTAQVLDNSQLVTVIKDSTNPSDLLAEVSAYLKVIKEYGDIISDIFSNFSRDNIITGLRKLKVSGYVGVSNSNITGNKLDLAIDLAKSWDKTETPYIYEYGDNSQKINSLLDLLPKRELNYDSIPVSDLDDPYRKAFLKHCDKDTPVDVLKNYYRIKVKDYFGDNLEIKIKRKDN